MQEFEVKFADIDPGQIRLKLKTIGAQKTEHYFEVVDSSKQLSISQAEINEACEWHKLFQEGYITAHEIAALEFDDKPETTGEIFKLETQNLFKIKDIINEGLDDDSFRLQIEKLHALLPRPFAAMVGMEQEIPHRGIDPVQHTINALLKLDTKGLPPEDQKIARWTMLFHDVGKVKDSFSRRHPLRSREITSDYLQKVSCDEEFNERIMHHIEWHDALGDIARRDGRNILNANEVASFFPTVKELELHRRIVKADVTSIPGLAQYERNIDLTFEAMKEKLEGGQSDLLIETAEDVAPPFAKIDISAFLDTEEKLFEPVEFNDVDIEQEMNRRRKSYEKLSGEEQEIIEKAVVQFGLQSRGLVLEALKATGQETSEAYIDYLEKKYQIKLPNIRIASNLFGLTYRLWEMRNLLLETGYLWRDYCYDHNILNDNVQDQAEDRPDQERIDVKTKQRVATKLIDVIKRARILSNYKVNVTHITDVKSAGSINQTRSIKKSEASISHQFEGNGVYGGILGSFKNWKGELDLDQIKEFKFQISLSHTLPIIVDYKFPKAMCNVLCDYLLVAPNDASHDAKTIATPMGLIEWNHYEYDDGETQEWKVKLLEKILNCRGIIVRDAENLKCVILDTEEEPIVWASLARALRINRIIPKSELYKTALPKPEINKVIAFFNKIKGVTVLNGVQKK